MMLKSRSSFKGIHASLCPASFINDMGGVLQLIQEIYHLWNYIYRHKRKLIYLIINRWKKKAWISITFLHSKIRQSVRKRTPGAEREATLPDGERTPRGTASPEPAVDEGWWRHFSKSFQGSESLFQQMTIQVGAYFTLTGLLDINAPGHYVWWHSECIFATAIKTHIQINRYKNLPTNCWQDKGAAEVRIWSWNRTEKNHRQIYKSGWISVSLSTKNNRFMYMYYVLWELN